MASSSGSAGPSQSSSKPAKAPSANTELPIKQIGKYEIQKKIGAGGMGAVYLAVDSTLRRTCALKILPRDKASNPILVQRFKAEARSAANLRHDNIVAVYETGEIDGYLYIALEYVDGTDVNNLVQKRGTIPLKRSVEMVRQIASALAHASQQGIVHRDIKPGNLLVRRDGNVKLADMGLARSLDESMDTSITRAGTTVGTVDYMAPEQARDSKAADVRSDIYSLGCTWYFMLTGEPPFSDGSLTNKLRAHAETPIPDPRSINPGVSEAVCGVLRRMTEKKPARRYQTPQELLDDLEAASLNSDLVSETILSDMSETSEAVDDAAVTRETGTFDEDDHDAPAEAGETGRSSRSRRKSKASKHAAADRDVGPAFKPPPGRDRGRDKQLETEKPKRTNAPLFYAIVGLVVFGAAAGIVSLVREFGMSSDTAQDDRTSNPFKRRDEIAKNAGPAGTGKSSVGGNTATSAAANPSIGQPGGTTVGSAQQTGNSEAGVSGQTSPVVGSGRTTTQIGGDGNIGASDAGNPAVASASGTSNAAVNGTTGSSGAGNSVSGGKTGQGVRSASPQVEARTRQELAFLPNWASKPRPAGKLPALLVQADASGAGKFATLNQALEQVPATGALIKLAGSGPFPLYPVKIADKTRVVIEPADFSNPAAGPIIMLLPSEQGAASDFVEFTNTTLDLRGVHLAIDASGSRTASNEALLSAISSDLFLENCSLTVKGLSDLPMTAVKVIGKVNRSDAKDNSQPRVLIDNTCIRGNNLTALVINSEHVDLAFRNALVWSGAARALRFGQIARSDVDSARHVRLASTTLSSQRCAVEVAGDASQPVPVSIELLNSLIAAPVNSDRVGSDNPAVLLSMEGWNQNQQKTAFGRLITWKATASLYTGWSTLIRLNPGAVASATSPSQWLSAWKDKTTADKDQFQEALWPGRPVADIAVAADFDALAPQTVGKQYVKTAEGGWPGCQTERLKVASVAALGPLQTAAARPALPRGLFQSPARNVIRVDAKEDVGKFLERQQLQNGTQIIVSGSGSRPSSPIVIENAWVRLQFEQTEGAPLVLVPKAGASKYDGFITVVNGGVEIVGGAFTTPASEKQTLPKWFVQVIDSDLAMWRCRVQGSLTGASRNKGLVQILSRSGRPPARPFEGSYDGYAWFDSCYLAGSGTMIEADTRRRALVVKNCVVVSRDDLFQLNLGQPDSQIGGAVDVSYSTLSAADSFFQVQGSDPGEDAQSPVIVFADRCVFAPPLREGKQKVHPTLLTYAEPTLDQQQFTWMEKRCGYAPEITRFLRDATQDVATSSQSFEKVWINQWGTDHVAEPLVGVNGVVLQKELPTKADERIKLEPADFQLHSACRAATWDDKRTIGAYLDTMNTPLLRPVSVAAEKKKPARQAAPSGGNSGPPGF
jgi:serine/threonine protein kinase